MARDVFISHSAHDKSVAEEICQALESSELTCWIAPRDLRPSRAFSAEITRAIQRCRAMVVIVSNHANSSPQVLSEVELAVNCEVPIVTFAIEQITEFGSLQYNLGGRTWIQSSIPPPSADIAELQVAVKNLMHQTDPSPPRNLSPSESLTARTGQVSARARSDFRKPLFLALIAIFVPTFVAYHLVESCLDKALSKFIPDSLTTALVLMALAIVATPYLAGQDVGPLKVPKVSETSARNLRIAGPILLITLLVILFVPLRFVLRQECNLIKNGSAEEGDVAWNAAMWTEGADGHLEIAVDYARRGSRSFKIWAPQPHHLRWVQRLRLEAHANYLLTAWVRTQDVAHSAQGEAADRGANIAIQFISPPQNPIHSEPLFYTNDWRQASVRFSTDEAIDIEVQLQLGAYSSTTTGTVWFDDVRLNRTW
ncbi:MAG: hypothetical protein QOK24_2066 [Verrucomicrobiota bacterium]|jgi:hypothetical protein